MTKIDKIRNSFDRVGIDAILITSAYNRRYVSHFTGSAGAVLISKKMHCSLLIFVILSKLASNVLDIRLCNIKELYLKKWHQS